MLSSRRSVSNENEVAALQPPPRKSTGRTPLQSLPPQTQTNFDASCSVFIQPLLVQPTISSDPDNLKILRSPALSSEAHLMNKIKTLPEKLEKCSTSTVIPIYAEENDSYFTQRDHTKVKTLSRSPLESNDSCLYQTQLALSKTGTRGSSVHDLRHHHFPNLSVEQKTEADSIVLQRHTLAKSVAALRDVIRDPELTEVFHQAEDLKLHQSAPPTGDDPLSSDFKQDWSGEAGVKLQNTLPLDMDDSKHEEQRVTRLGESLQPEHFYFAVSPLNILEGDYSKHCLPMTKQNSVYQLSQSDGMTRTDNFRGCLCGAEKNTSESQLIHMPAEGRTETLVKPAGRPCETSIDSLQRSRLEELNARSCQEFSVMKNEMLKSLPQNFKYYNGNVVNEVCKLEMGTCENSVAGKVVYHENSSILHPTANKCSFSTPDSTNTPDEVKGSGLDSEMNSKQNSPFTVLGSLRYHKPTEYEPKVASVAKHICMPMNSPCKSEVTNASVMQVDSAENIIGPLTKLDISSQCAYSVKKNNFQQEKDAVLSSLKQDHLHGHTRLNFGSQAVAVLQVETSESPVQSEDLHISHLNGNPAHVLEMPNKTSVLASDCSAYTHTPVSTTKNMCTSSEMLLENFVTSSPELGDKTVVLPSVSFNSMQLNGSPVLSSNVATWVSPASLLERSTNTSLLPESVKNVERFAKDNAAETDSLLWNFSKKALSSAPRGELEHHLESALIVNEVLSQQVKELRSCSSTPYPGPSALRDVVTQTDISLLSEAERRYQHLYRRSVERVRCLEHGQEMLRKLWESQHCTFEHLSTLTVKSDSFLEFVDDACTKTQEDNKTLHSQMFQMRSLLSKNQELLQKMKIKVQSCVEECENMKAQVDAAYKSKELTEQCLEEFRSHSATRINRLTCTSETLKEILDLLKEAYSKQCVKQKELMDTSVCTDKICLDVEEEHFRMLQQMRKCKDLSSRNRLLLQAMSKKTQTILQEHAEMRLKMEISVEENAKLQHQLEQATADLNFSIDQIQLLNQENQELEVEIKALQQTISEMESERNQLQEEKDACYLKLNSRDDSLKLMESRLAEEMSKLEQVQQEKEQLIFQVSDLEKQQDYLKNLLQQQDEHSCQISWQQSQCTAMAEKIEFLEYENQLHLQHLADVESKMKTNLYSLRERNVQCEELKKQVSQLQRERDALQEELDCTKAEARFMLLKLGRETRNSSLELSKIKEKLQDFIGSLKDTSFEEKPLDTPAAKNRSFVASVLEAFTGQQMVEETEIDDDIQKDQPVSLGSEKSAFTRVEPTTPKREPEAEQSLWTSVTDIDETVANLLVVICEAQEKTQLEIQKLQHELSLVQEEQQNVVTQHSSEVKSLQVQIEELEHKNQKLNQVLEKNESLQEEVEQLKHALGEETKKLHEELESSGYSSAVPENRDLLQEDITQREEVNKLKKLLSECEKSKSEILARAHKHRMIQDDNIRKTEEELQKLDSIIEHVRETLMCIPNVVAGCKELQTLLEFIG